MLKHKLYLSVALGGFLVLVLWNALPGQGRAPAGAACRSNGECRSRICLPDAEPAEVDRFVEITKAYDTGRRAEPKLAGRIEELVEKMPGSSLTLRPKYPGVCTERCANHQDCPPGMFCTVVVRVGLSKRVDLGQMQVCMPENHPAARLVR